MTTYGSSTARSAFLVLNGRLELAVADELIKRSPASSRIVKKPARTSSSVVIESAAGLRQGEIFGLAPDDLDFDEQIIRVRRQVKRLGKEYVFTLPKSDKERVDGGVHEVDLQFVWTDSQADAVEVVRRTRLEAGARRNWSHPAGRAAHGAGTERGRSQRGYDLSGQPPLL
ncbi:hypothetical protein E0H75_35625 [Kribbella capetownensis]|uniref:Tyr recombinase domain-containing protein n=1 Tax=Kribbella capetownensis TaxID=1572659 RepID=A0A4R0JDR9_9ACTN|nr:hypothetical protein [Kribbella capetownensis]TCC44197.1 hypothetical protein E0H75_35625 [Kribbella capetownensis]